jgi:hypothetical protein
MSVDLWIMAGEAAETDAAEHKLALARVACACYWPVLASATTEEGLDHAKALISEGVTTSVAGIASSPAEQAILASRVLDSFNEDWQAHHAVVEDAAGYGEQMGFGFPAEQDSQTDQAYQDEITAWRNTDHQTQVDEGNGIGISDDSSGPNVTRPGQNAGQAPVLHPEPPIVTASLVDIEAGLAPGDYHLDAFGALIRVALKMSPDHVNTLRRGIEPHDTPERREQYSKGDYPRSDKVKDPDKRYRWDLLWHSKALNDLPDDHGYNDDHIDSALKSIVPPLSSKRATVGNRIASKFLADKAPYYIREEGDSFKVVNRDGDVKGTFSSKDQARQQQKALYVNIPDASGKAEKAHGHTPEAVSDVGKKASRASLTSLQRQAVRVAHSLVDQMPIEAQHHAVAKAMLMRARGFNLTDDETDLVITAALNRVNERLQAGGSLDFTKQAGYDNIAAHLHRMNHGDRTRYESEGHPFEVSYHERPAYGDMGQPVEKSDMYSGTTGEYTLYHPHGQAQEFHVGPSVHAKGYQAEKVRDTMMDTWSKKKMNRLMSQGNLHTADGVSQEKRDRDEKAGDTLPGTDKFPISNASDLAKAKHDIGRTNEPHDKVVRYIDRKAEELGEPGVGEGDDKSKEASMQKGAPFAGYRNFQDCVKKNQDKENPEGYCGKIKLQTEGSDSRSRPRRMWDYLMGRTAQDMTNPMDPSSTANPFSPAQDVNASTSDSNPDMGGQMAGPGGVMDPGTQPPDEIAGQTDPGSATGTAASSKPRTKPSSNPNAPNKPRPQQSPMMPGMPGAGMGMPPMGGAQMMTGLPMTAMMAMASRAQVIVAESILNDNPEMSEKAALHLAARTIDRYPHLVREAYGGYDFPFGDEDKPDSYTECPQCNAQTFDARSEHCHNCGYLGGTGESGYDPLVGETTIQPGRADLRNPGTR